MDAKRRGEIAVLIIENSIQKNGYSMSPQEHNRKLEEVSQSIGVSVQELREFFKPIVEKLFEEYFGKK